MTKFIVDDSFWELFPDAKIGVVLLKDYKAGDVSPYELQDLLADSNQIAKGYLIEDTFSENPVIKVYRQAFQRFKTKKGARSSIEALLKRTSGDNPVSSINPLVDIYNAASLRYALPCGAEDSDTFVGDLRLGITEGGDDFYLIGEDDNKPTLPNELCYTDEVGAVCRCLNWRDGKRTMITNQTTNAFLVIELLDPSREEALHQALDFIIKQSVTFLGATANKRILDKENPDMII
ncbi:B3/4 domain-containing protein [Streptococcus sp. zg-JUN1979]|uniref:B3/B4 domain-containing protein n=1 Tax=Streptococcus sp. zg-JUN1979 TaxID=3391450 RepID=UPI0039A52A5D